MSIEEKDFHVFEPGYNDHFIARKGLKWITGIKYRVTLPTSFEEHAQFRRWCLENCTGPVCYVEEHYARHPEVYFFNPEDATAAKLRWEEQQVK